MKVQEVITKKVVKIRSSATVAEAVKLMKEEGLIALIVECCNEDNPYSILTQTDIFYKVVAHGYDPQKMLVNEIMTKPCLWFVPI